MSGDASTGMALARDGWRRGHELLSAGGTSAATPLWGGLMADADQLAGHDLGFADPALYRIARGPLYGQAFHDVTTGNNTVVMNGTTYTGYQAGPGWDPVTGLGSPDAAVLVPILSHRPIDGGRQPAWPADHHRVHPAARHRSGPPAGQPGAQPRRAGW